MKKRREELEIRDKQRVQFLEEQNKKRASLSLEKRLAKEIKINAARE